MPASAILLSILGLAPFVGCGLAALGSNPVTADRMLTALIAWGALVLAFTGGLHWGLELRQSETGPPGSPAPGTMRHARIGLAVLPLILGWVALLLPLVVAPWLGLLLLIATFIATLAAEHHFSTRVTLPPRYLWLRWGFTIVAVAMLTTVLTLRLLGQTIVL
ncbi:MAG TPA: DUF3429 domain-containing protein [Acetobacteraceae bacterium]|nr:DUF3429 domain-containing protein [Acetobacteraceae bacterium]